ncbi:hypothetical protein AZI98_00210 [Aeribacillus pallidus]|uniref:Uncharacterized protein n=1 Tax=Aeribacillus pallidus TaxID=33936 RepID=A0A162CAH1_9BACI|nr:hypothetical protein AZI98_00210 [Aeribacillus pallidus]
MKDDGIIGKEFKKRAFTLPFRKENAALSFEEKMAIAKLHITGNYKLYSKQMDEKQFSRRKRSKSKITDQVSFVDQPCLLTDKT